MRILTVASSRHPAPVVSAFLADLRNSVDWVPFVARAEADGVAWDAVLSATIGRRRRSKRLRFVRVEGEGISFVREELRRRSFASWSVTFVVRPVPAGSTVECTLDYGGSLLDAAFSASLRTAIDECVTSLDDAIDRCGHASASGPPPPSAPGPSPRQHEAVRS
jgi:Polyketide cyclase / dehydrase and lipid transport